MVMNEEELYEAIFRGFLIFKSEAVKASIDECLKKGIDPFSIQEKGLRRSLERLGELFEKGEVFIPHLMLGAKIFNEGIEILKPHITGNKTVSELGTAVIGTVYGDLHDLGKNLVGLMWSIIGFNVIDLGVNVPTDIFMKTVAENNAKILGLSSLLTTTMLEQRNIIETLTENNMRDQVMVLVGGASVSERWAEEIGADGYATDVGEAVRLAKRFVGAI